MDLLVDNEKRFEISDSNDIYKILKANDVYLVAPCGGKGVCSKCKAKVLDGEYEVKTYGKLDKKERESGIVLACQTIPKSDLSIEIPKEARLAVGDKIAVAKFKDTVEYLKSYDVSIDPIVKSIFLELPPPTIDDNLSDLERLKRALEDKGIKNLQFSYELTSTLLETLRNANWNVMLTYIEGYGVAGEALSIFLPDECWRRYGVAIDIGTTTVVVYLIDLEKGDVIDIGSTYNAQMRFGDDVITRIVHATEGGGLEELRDAVVSDIDAIIISLAERHSINNCEIDAAVIAANTTMSQLFWGLDPSSIREDPYIPTLNYYPMWRGSTSRLSINPQSPVYTVPSIASYVGGDIVSGVLASKMHRNDEIALFMDIGTNGEIVIGNKEWLMAAACSAGPCFEGGGIKNGMRATEGAIEAVKINPDTYDLATDVIGGVSPIGICGSGMIDAVVEMFMNGIIDQKGNFIKDKTDRVRESEEGPEFLLYSDRNLNRDIVLTKVDLENLIRAKAAIYAGVSLIIKEVGLTIDVIEKVYIAGGFGNYINPERAIIFGMFPDMPKEKFVFLGNTSVIGAYLTLLSDKLLREVEDIASRMTYLELSATNAYMEEYMSAMFIPHTDISQFPTVSNMLRT